MDKTPNGKTLLTTSEGIILNYCFGNHLKARHKIKSYIQITRIMNAKRIQQTSSIDRSCFQQCGIICYCLDVKRLRILL